MFRKDVTYDNMKSYKKRTFTLSRKHFFGKIKGRRGQIDLPSLFRVNLKLSFFPKRLKKIGLFWLSKRFKLAGIVFIVKNTRHRNNVF